MAKLIDLTLDELYDRPKMTAAVLKAIYTKQEFSTRDDRYCDKACLLTCNNKEQVHLNHTKADVVIVQSHKPPPDKWKSSHQIDKIHQGIIAYLGYECFGDNIRYRVVNTLKCDVTPENLPFPKKEHTQTTILKCAPYMLEEIKQSGAKVVISTTTAATKALGLLHVSNYNNRGEVHVSPKLNIPVVITLHPKVTTMIRQNSSGQMWGPDYLDVIKRDFSKAARLVNKSLVIPNLQDAVKEATKQIVICRSIPEIKKWMSVIENLPSETVVSWDLETTSLDPWASDARILTTQYGYRGNNGKIQAIVIPLWHKDNHAYNADEAWVYAKLPIINPNIKKVGHNLKFDFKYCVVTTGDTPQNIAFDTMLLLHDMNSGITGNYGLKRAVWDYLPESGLGGYEDLLEAHMAAEKAAAIQKQKERDKLRKAAEREAKKLEKARLKEEQQQAQLQLLN